MTGIVVSDSILIVEFAGSLRKQGFGLKAALAETGKVRLTADFDDHAGHHIGFDPDGACIRARQRTICTAGARHFRRVNGIRYRYSVPGTSRVFALASQ